MSSMPPLHDSASGSNGPAPTLVRILTIVLLYAAFAGIWILLSDKAIAWLFPDPSDLALVSTLKGFAFVAVTSLLLYALMRRLLNAKDATPILRTGRRQLVISLGLLAVAIFGLTASGIYYAVVQQRGHATAQLNAIVDLKSRQIEDWLAERYGDARFVQSNPFWFELFQRWRDLNDPASWGLLKDRMNQFRIHKAFDGIILLDADGRFLWGSENNRYTTNPAIEAHQNVRQVTHVGPYAGANGHLHLDFLAPLAGPQNTAGPLVVLHVDPARYLFPLLQNWPAPSSTGETLLFRQEGDQVLYLNELRHRSGTACNLRVPLDKDSLIAAKSLHDPRVLGHLVKGQDYRGKTVFGIVKSVSGTDWYLAAKLDESELLSAALKDAVWIGLAGLLGLFITGAGIILLRQRQELAAALRESELKAEELRALQLLGAISEASGDAIFAKDKEGRYLLFNREAARLLGVDPQQVLGHDDLRLFPAEQGALVMANDRQVMLENRTATFHETLSTVEGDIVFQATKGPLHDKGGNVIGVFGISRDITELKQAETALRESTERLADREKYLRTILQTTADGFCVVDGQGRIVDVNEAYCRMTGYRREELVAMRINVIDATEGPSEIMRRMPRVLSRGPELFESRHRRKDGSIFDVELSITELEAEDRRLVFSCRDITERKRAEAENLLLQTRMQQAQKMESIGNLAGGIAHDFNNILFPIIGFSEMLLDEQSPDKPEAESLREIISAAKRGSDLVRQILAFSRRSEHQMIPVQVQQVLNEVHKLVRATIPSDISISFDIQKGCPLVMADPTQLHQIAMNLITNAYHAVEQSRGGIAVSLRQAELGPADVVGRLIPPGGYAVLTVSDSGSGIEPAIMEKIFEPYFTTKGKGKGTGLGLSVVYGIIKEHKGDIKVASELGKGATFTVYLPLMEKSAQAASSESEEILPTGTERILLVDDEAAVARMVKRILERLGYRVSAHTSSLEALALFQADPNAFDVLLTDMTMPNMTGDRLANAVRSIRPDLPVIICTGYSDRINPEKAAAMGINGFLMKPLVRTELARTLREVLAQSDAVGVRATFVSTHKGVS